METWSKIQMFEIPCNVFPFIHYNPCIATQKKLFRRHQHNRVSLIFFHNDFPSLAQSYLICFIITSPFSQRILSFASLKLLMGFVFAPYRFFYCLHCFIVLVMSIERVYVEHRTWLGRKIFYIEFSSASAVFLDGRKNLKEIFFACERKRNKYERTVSANSRSEP